MKTVVLFKVRKYFDYDLGWRDALLACSGLRAKAFAFRWLDPLMMRAILRSDLIILLRSVDLGYRGRKTIILRQLVQRRRGKLVYFPRNEFKNFLPKREFIKEAHVDLVASQLPLAGASYLYGDLTKVISLPHAANLDIYKPQIPFARREITIGSRTAKYPLFLLDNSRNSIGVLMEHIKAVRKNWVIDYSNNLADRFDQYGWSYFLNKCKFTVATEAGASYVDKTDQVQKDIQAYISQYPEVQPDQLERAFAHRINNLPSGKCISPRHFEAIACKTCQVLIEGEYNGILEPGRHYIPLKKDFSNLDEVLTKMENQKLVNDIVEEAYCFVKEKHTHKDRIEYLMQELGRLT